MSHEANINSFYWGTQARCNNNKRYINHLPTQNIVILHKIAVVQLLSKSADFNQNQHLFVVFITRHLKQPWASWNLSRSSQSTLLLAILILCPTYAHVSQLLSSYRFCITTSPMRAAWQSINNYYPCRKIWQFVIAYLFRFFSYLWWKSCHTFTAQTTLINTRSGKLVSIVMIMIITVMQIIASAGQSYSVYYSVN